MFFLESVREAVLRQRLQKHAQDGSGTKFVGAVYLVRKIILPETHGLNFQIYVEKIQFVSDSGGIALICTVAEVFYEQMQCIGNVIIAVLQSHTAYVGQSIV